MAGDLTSEFANFARDVERASDAIKAEIGALIPVAAETMAAAVTARYSTTVRTGTLRSGTRIRTAIGNDPLLPVRKVIGPPLAYIWQDGTTVRRNYSRHNANRGRSPAHDRGMFQRTAAQTRAAMLAEAQRLLDRPREI